MSQHFRCSAQHEKDLDSNPASATCVFGMFRIIMYLKFIVYTHTHTDTHTHTVGEGCLKLSSSGHMISFVNEIHEINHLSELIFAASSYIRSLHILGSLTYSVDLFQC